MVGLERSLEGGVPLADVLRGGVRLGSLEDRGEARAGPQLRDATLRYYMMMIAHDGMTKIYGIFLNCFRKFD